jgi:hypothetical protein
VRHPEGRAERGEQELRRFAPSGDGICRRHRTLVAEDHQPGIGADHEAGPEAQADHDKKDDRDRVVAPGHHVGERIAQSEAGERNDERRLERVEHHVGVERNGQQAAIVIERYLRIGDAEQQHIADRNDEQKDDAYRCRGDQQPCGQAIAGRQPPDCRHRRSFAHLSDDVTCAAGWSHLLLGGSHRTVRVALWGME